jgi:hypothetical protein
MKKKKKYRPQRRFVKCEHCDLLFEEKRFAENCSLKKCPACGKFLDRTKMLKEYYKRQGIISGRLPCPFCGMIHTRKNADENGNINCKKCGYLIAHIGKGITVLSIGV